MGALRGLCSVDAEVGGKLQPYLLYMYSLVRSTQVARSFPDGPGTMVVLVFDS